eukprot:12611715-Heterocapsa_arctica.AAC.1
MFSANSDAHDKSISSGASDLGYPRVAMPAAPAASSGGRSISELLGQDASNYIATLFFPAEESDGSIRSSAHKRQT